MWWSTVISVYVYPARVLTTKTVDGEPGPDHCVQDAEGGEGHVELSRRFWGRTVRKAYTVDGSEIPRLTTWDGWKPINNGIYYHHWWWQLKYSLFSPRTLGMISNLTNNFQRVGSTTNYSYMFGFVWLVAKFFLMFLEVVLIWGLPWIRVCNNGALRIWVYYNYPFGNSFPHIQPLINAWIG